MRGREREKKIIREGKDERGAAREREGEREKQYNKKLNVRSRN